MSKRVNQHFVPQFYFRQFSGGANCIQAYFPQQSRVIRDAPIKGQCASARFYGDDETEAVLSKLEGQYSIALRSMIVAAWANDPASMITPSALQSVDESILVQKARTRLAVDRATSRNAAWMMEWFRQDLAASSDAEDQHVLSLLNANPHKLQLNGPAMALLDISIAILTAQLLSDLDFCLIRNQTDLPFIFCDSPVIFHNTYYHNVKHRGVLGTATPGLQIFLPLNARLCLMLFDPKPYECTYHDSACVDVWSKPDISQINALQIHGCDQAVYFADYLHKDYVTDLWKTHGPTRLKETKILHVHDDWLFDNRPVKGLMHQFDPLHNIRLDLSFVKCNPIEENDFRPGKRDPELAKMVDERMEREFAAADAEHALKTANGN